MSRFSFRAHLRSAMTLILLVLLGLATPGCSWIQKNWTRKLEGDAEFPEWSQSMSGSARPKSSEAKPSGLLFDKRSQEIEKNLGGNF